MENPILKLSPNDFIVTENYISPRYCPEHGVLTYLLLTKSGFTTFDAIDRVAQHMHLEPTQVQAAGLKDEDGITQQLVAVAGDVAQSMIDEFNISYANCRKCYIRLQKQGVGNEPIRTGVLHGNSFRICVRNLSKSLTECLRENTRHYFHFLNYYGIQRFGTADGPKTTHLIGSALLNSDYEKALGLVIKSGTSESTTAESFRDSPEEFFSHNPRITCFYKSANMSHGWNKRLAAQVTNRVH